MQAFDPSRLDGTMRLDNWGVIRAAGADAATFLHSQLTQDVQSLNAQQARLAGYCSAKGRLLASFVICRPHADELLLACSADLLPSTLKRLSMFVLRSKCKLSDASAELPVHGVVGSGARALAVAWACRHDSERSLIRLPDAMGQARALCIGKAPALPAFDAQSWHWLEVASGVPRIEAATVEQFVPQMVNLEVVGGVNFQKGCYPGQEVVARSQYRGSVKRRAFVFSVTSAAAPAQEIFHDSDGAQPAGLVVNAASFGATHLVLAEVKIAALSAGRLHLASPGGALLTPHAMSYVVPLEATS